MDDPAINLFQASLAAGAPMSFQPGGVYLDLGSCEADWLHEVAHKNWPQTNFVGLDWRAPNDIDCGGMVTRVKGNGLDPDTFPPEYFDGIVSLSAIEHFGLGHYSQDPKDVDGDTHAIANGWKWLKPGGFLYFDVPYHPEHYAVVHTTEYRTYNDDALWTRLWMQPLVDAKTSAQWRWTGYCLSNETRALIGKPIEQDGDQLRYYIANCWHKVRTDAS